MRILWVTAQILPLVYEELEIESNNFGGWIMNMLEQLERLEMINLGVVMVSPKVRQILEVKKGNIVCFVAPSLENKGISNEDRDYIVATYKPDIIHIEGNEFGIHNSFSKIKEVPYLLSLQGILAGHEQYQYGELPLAEFMLSPFKHNAITAWILYFRKQFLFNKRMEIESLTIKNAKYISGRTYWDRAHSYWINPKAKYFSCNRILRPIFYQSIWKIEFINHYTIFVGNGYSPLKGLHNVIEAVQLLKDEYPSIRVYVAGDNPTIKTKNIFKNLGYGNLIRRKIKKYGLNDNIIFTGSLNGNEMVEYMLNSNVYVLPSLIENSPNTLGEAMILGMPCVSAYTGGASEMALDEKECLFYRANDPKLLAWQLKRIFDDDNMGKKLGIAARNHALNTHDPIKNRDALIFAYKEILKSENKVE